MLYRFLKIIVRIAIRIFCRRVIINKPALLKEKGPLLVACNHPNSFLDSVILDTIFREPVWSLARGDVFKKPLFIKWLTALKILPVYRSSEGVENLSENYKTFADCLAIFRNKGVICIFSEGKCVNEWKLRPLKKGTARLAVKAWDEQIPLKVLPVGLNYSSFNRFGKNMFINFGEIIRQQDFDNTKPDGLRHQEFNSRLRDQLVRLVYEIPGDDKQAQRKLLEIKPGLLEKSVLAIPAAIGWLIHTPLYWPVKKFTLSRTYDNDHYDSIMIALLLFTYPLYLLLIVAVLYLATGSWWPLLLFILAPLTAWAYVALKPQLDK